MPLDGRGSGPDDLCPLCGDTVWSHLYENDVPRECACCGCRAYLDGAPVEREMLVSQKYVDWAHGPAAEETESPSAKIIHSQKTGRSYRVQLAADVLKELRSVASLWAGDDNPDNCEYTSYARRLLKRLEGINA